MARNLVEGNGLVFNPGERVLATSSPLHAIVLGLAGVLVGPQLIPLLAVITNILFDTGSYWILNRWIYSATGSHWFAIACAWLFALDQLVIEYSSSGKDTSLYLFILLACFLAFQERRATLVGILSGLAMICRPEGVLLGAVMLSFAAWRERVWPWRTTTIAAIISGTYYALTTWYYGSPIPQGVVAFWNSPQIHGAFGHWHTAYLFAIQAGFSLYGFAIWRVWHHWIWSQSLEVIFQVILIVGQIALCVWGARQLARRDLSIAASAVFTLLHAVFFSLGNPRMYGWYQVPLDPLIVIYLAGAIWMFCDKCGNLKKALLWPMFLALQCLHIAWAGDSRTLWLLADHWDRGPEQAMERACTAIKKNGIKPTDTVLAIYPGIPRWRLDARVWDMIGLSNPAALRYAKKVLRKDVWEKGNPSLSSDLVMDLKPRYLITTEWPQIQWYRKDPRFMQTYRLLNSDRVPPNPHYVRLPNILSSGDAIQTYVLIEKLR